MTATFHSKNLAMQESILVFNQDCELVSQLPTINYQLQKSEAFQSVHHVTFILCYTVLYNFFALVFALISVRKHWWDDITQGKQ